MSGLRFDGQVAIITGAGGGLGRAHALELARRGALVLVNDLGGALDGTGSSMSAADRVVREITALGGTAAANHDSVATPEGGQAIVQAAVDAFGRVDVLVNNAGILRDKAFHKMDAAMVKAVIDVHLKGAFNVTQPAFVLMRAQGYGRIVNTSSASGLFGNFGQANYGAVKAALAALARILAIEGAKYGIKANAIAPLAATRMTEDILEQALKDLFQPGYVSALVAYLANENCAVSGHIYSVAGGRVARIFVGETRGQTGCDTAEAIMGKIDAIDHLDPNDFDEPSDLTEESQIIAKALRELIASLS